MIGEIKKYDVEQAWIEFGHVMVHACCTAYDSLKRRP